MTAEEEPEILQKPKIGENQSEIMSSWHDGTPAFMYKIKPVNMLVWRGMDSGDSAPS